MQIHAPVLPIQLQLVLHLFTNGSETQLVIADAKLNKHAFVTLKLSTAPVDALPFRLAHLRKFSTLQDALVNVLQF